MLQDDGNGVGAGAPMRDVLVVMQGSEGGIQRPDQAFQRRPLRGGPSGDAPGAVASQLAKIQLLERPCLLRQQPGGAVELVRLEAKVPALRSDVVGNGGCRQRAAHAPVSAIPVSMPTRSACRWAIERFSLAARSRPDKWM